MKEITEREWSKGDSEYWYQTVSNKPIIYGGNDMDMELLQKAFEYAEQKTADYYEGRSCGIMDKEGKHSCPICYFRVQVKDFIKCQPNIR